MFKQTAQGVEVAIYVQPNSSKTQIVGEHNGFLKIKIKSPPLDGKANDEVIEFLSKHLNYPRKKIHLIKGDKSREKKVLLQDFPISDINRFFQTK